MKYYYVIFIAVLAFLLISLTTETLRAAHSSSHSGGGSIRVSASASASASAHASAGSFGRGWGWGGWVWSPAWNWGNSSYYNWGGRGYGYDNSGYSNEIMKTPGVHPWRLPETKFSLQHNTIQHYFPEDVKDHPPVPPNTYSD